MSERPEQLSNIQKEAYQLFLQKNTDYGDAFAKYGPIGVLVRIGDKIQRLQHISKTDITLVKTESLRDTLIDLHNYAAMAVMLLDKNPEKINQPPQIVLPNTYSDSSISDNDQHGSYYVGTPPHDREYFLERNFVTDPQENGGKCSTS
jgi:hypothetical protein